jgi:hypoxanthine phosphoribosyltransferase
MSVFPKAEIVATESEVDKAYRRLAAELQPIVSDQDCVLLGVLLGGLMPLARLAGLLTGDYVLDCCQVSRYRGGVSGGELDWVQPPRAEIEGRTVLLIDDIFDEGATLDFTARQCRALGAERVVSAVLVRKRHARVIVEIQPDFVGVEVDDRYVFGAGMDYGHRWRHLPAIYALSDDTVEHQTLTDEPGQ